VDQFTIRGLLCSDVWISHPTRSTTVALAGKADIRRPLSNVR